MLRTDLLRIGDFPSRDRLCILKQNSFYDLINVSGIDLEEVYPNYDFSLFNVSQFVFTDIFSLGTQLQLEPRYVYPEMDVIDEGLYISKSSFEHRQAFLQAVIQLNNKIINKKPCYLFCYLGQGRSAAVAAVSLLSVYSIPLDTLQTTLHGIRPQALLTDVSLSAIKWSFKRINT